MVIKNKEKLPILDGLIIRNCNIRLGFEVFKGNTASHGYFPNHSPQSRKRTHDGQLNLSFIDFQVSHPIINVLFSGMLNFLYSSSVSLKSQLTTKLHFWDWAYAKFTFFADF